MGTVSVGLTSGAEVEGTVASSEEVEGAVAMEAGIVKSRRVAQLCGSSPYKLVRRRVLKKEDLGGTNIVTAVSRYRCAEVTRFAISIIEETTNVSESWIIAET